MPATSWRSCSSPRSTESTTRRSAFGCGSALRIVPTRRSTRRKSSIVISVLAGCRRRGRRVRQGSALGFRRSRDPDSGAAAAARRGRRAASCRSRDRSARRARSARRTRGRSRRARRAARGGAARRPAGAPAGAARSHGMQRARVVERGHRVQRAAFELGAQRRVVLVGQLAGAMVEVRLADREQRLLLVVLRRARSPDARRRRSPHGVSGASSGQATKNAARSTMTRPMMVTSTAPRLRSADRDRRARARAARAGRGRSRTAACPTPERRHRRWRAASAPARRRSADHRARSRRTARSRPRC